VLFFPGCNLCCPWCQNRELVLPGAEKEGGCTIEEALKRILKRRPVLGGVVLSGGEPTVHRGLGEVIRRIKALGLPVKLDTNGTNPESLEDLFSREETRPDYIALDLKLPPERYGELTPERTGNAGNRAGTVPSGNFPAPVTPGEALVKSAALVRSSGIEHEFRTLAFPNRYLAPEEIPALAALAGDAPWYFRPFRPGNCLDPAWNGMNAPGPEETASLARKAREAGKKGIEL
jgi:pyruvate formate lyase activating enzyme